MSNALQRLAAADVPWLSVRRFVFKPAWWAGGSLVVLLLLAAIYMWGVPALLPGGRGTSSGPIAAKDNVQTALSWATTYSARHRDGFTGLASGSANSGLLFTTGASKGPHVVSTRVMGAGKALVLAAWEPGSMTWYGILDVTAGPKSPIFGEKVRGTYYFVVETTTAALADCNASILVPSAISASGFPSTS